MSQYTETLNLESASAWDKFYLARFGVDFNRNEHTELKTLIVDPKWYDPGTEETKNFAKRIPTPRVLSGLLMEGYSRIVKASESFSEKDLRKARDDETVEEKLDANPLKGILLNLLDLLETDSEESQERERKKFKITPPSVLSSEPSSEPSLEPSPPTSQSTSERSPQLNRPRFPISYTTPDKKRKVSDSDTSFETKSTESTPTKLAHPEARVQSLQDEFVKTLIRDLWWGKVDVSWARGRRMFLTYSEYFPSRSHLY
jgi:hypothetical protein